MKKIPLTQGKYALVDDADYEWLNIFKWYAYQDRNTWYARRSSNRHAGSPVSILIHREILGLELGDKQQCDHRDHNGLNNQRSNLRICSNAENQHNQKLRLGKTSVFKGVCWHKRERKWTARIRHENKRINLGIFNSESEAARAYDQKAKELFGEYAKPNFPEEVV